MSDLLPSTATAFERAASLAIDPSARLSGGVAALRLAKRVSIPDALLPFLVAEYGLGPVSAYLADQRAVLTQGIAWQRVRGTPDAVARGLSWVGYSGQLEEAPVLRRRWHLFGVALDRVRDQETPDLEALEGVVGLSVPVRSAFYRGHAGYNLRELEWSRRRYAGARWSGSSGARLTSGGTKWSFGRGGDFSVTVGKADLVALGAWQDVSDATVLGWGGRFLDLYDDNQITWGPFAWNATPQTWGGGSRLATIAAAVIDRPVWVAFRGASGALIGHRRARVVRAVLPTSSGVYEVGGVRFTPMIGGAEVYIEARTDFGDGAGSVCATVSLLFDAVPLDPTRPGLQWAPPGALTPGIEIASRPYAKALGATVRERVRYHLQF